MGELIRAGFRDALAGVAGVVEIRGMGLMIGIELDRPCGELVKRALDAGLLINVTADNVVRLLPPLVITRGRGARARRRARAAGPAPSSRKPRLTARRAPMATPQHFLQFKRPLARGVRAPVRAHALDQGRSSSATSATGRSTTARW